MQVISIFATKRKVVFLKYAFEAQHKHTLTNIRAAYYDEHLAALQTPQGHKCYTVSTNISANAIIISTRPPKKMSGTRQVERSG